MYIPVTHDTVDWCVMQGASPVPNAVLVMTVQCSRAEVKSLPSKIQSASGTSLCVQCDFQVRYKVLQVKQHYLVCTLYSVYGVYRLYSTVCLPSKIQSALG